MVYDKEMRRIGKLINRYSKQFGLFGPRGWEITCELTDSIAPGCGGAINEGDQVAGACDAAPAYKCATLTFSRDSVRRYDDEELDQLVKHEMLHIVTSPLYQWATDMLETMPKANRIRLWKAFSQVNETVTTDLERIIN